MMLAIVGLAVALCVGILPSKHCVSSTTVFANDVLAYSSQYNDHSWAANKVLGAPDVYPNYGDVQNTWAQDLNVGTKDSHFIVVNFDKFLKIRAVNVYETFHAGGVVKISTRNPTGQYVTLWETATARDLESSRIFSPDIQVQTFASNIIRLDVDCSVSNTWVEIDAISIVGDDEPVTTMFANELLSYSSQYNTDSWAANKVLGAPDVYPNWGDLQNTWAQDLNIGAKDSHFIEVKFEHAIMISAVNIYETYHAGGVVKVSTKNPDGQYVTLWETATAQNIGRSRLFSPAMTAQTFPSDVIRLDVDCSVSNSWVEIDAIEIVGYEVVCTASRVTILDDIQAESIGTKVGAVATQQRCAPLDFTITVATHQSVTESTAITIGESSEINWGASVSVGVEVGVNIGIVDVSASVEVTGSVGGATTASKSVEKTMTYGTANEVRHDVHFTGPSAGMAYSHVNEYKVNQNDINIDVDISCTDGTYKTVQKKMTLTATRYSHVNLGSQTAVFSDPLKCTEATATCISHINAAKAADKISLIKSFRDCFPDGTADLHGK